MTQNHHTQLPANAQTITFDAVSQSFPQSGKNTHEVLREVSFTAAAGEIISVIGASGCGKSTLLRAAAGLNRITGGQVRIGDPLGPTLAEALDEINREIVREYAQASRAHHSAKH